MHGLSKDDPSVQIGAKAWGNKKLMSEVPDTLRSFAELCHRIESGEVVA